MATTILNSFNSVTLSGGIGDVFIQTSANRVTFSIEYVDDVSSYEIFKSSYYPHSGGHISIYNITEVIEGFMEVLNTSYIKIALKVEGDDSSSDEKIIEVVYCKREPQGEDVERFLSSRFLTSSNVMVVPPSSIQYLPLFISPGEPLSTVYYILGIDSNGEETSVTETAEGGKVTGEKIKYIPINLSELASRYNFQRLKEVTVCVGERSMVYLISSEVQTSDVFEFRNIFNTTQWLYLMAQSVDTEEVDQQTASIVGETIPYDKKITSYKSVETAGLNPKEVETFRQFISSSEINKIEFPNPSDQTSPFKRIPVYLDDISFEVSDDPENLPSVKFAWRPLRNRRPLNIDIPARHFTDQFTPSFN